MCYHCWIYGNSLLEGIFTDKSKQWTLAKKELNYRLLQRLNGWIYWTTEHSPAPNIKKNHFRKENWVSEIVLFLLLLFPELDMTDTVNIQLTSLTSGVMMYHDTMHCNASMCQCGLFKCSIHIVDIRILLIMHAMRLHWLNTRCPSVHNPES